MQLSAPEIRVLACLIEKEAAVPDSYPLTQSALRLACNQATNRRPVVAYDDRTVESALMTLKSVGLVRFVHPAQGGRTTRYRHTVGERWRLSPGEALALSALALRGPQTGAEVRTRIERLLPTGERGSIDVMLDTLAARSPEPLVARLERRPGERDVRWVATFGEPFDPAVVDRLAADELDDSTADLPRPARTVADGFRFDAPAPAAAPLASTPGTASAPSTAEPPRPVSPVSGPDLAQLSARVEELGAVIGAVAARLDRLERDLGVRD